MIKSYYLTKNKIVVRDFSNKKTIYDLTRQNIMNLITDLDKQIPSDIDNILENEDNTYKMLTNKIGVVTLGQLFLTSLIFLGFTNASYVSIILGVILSLMTLTYTFITMFKGMKEIRNSKRLYQVYVGREILVKTYNSLLAKSNMEGELVDVY